MYNDNIDNINNNCRTTPDVTSLCSTLDNCHDCAQNVICSWCPLMGRCVTSILDNMPYPLEEYKCTDGRTKICCESYTDCYTCS